MSSKRRQLDSDNSDSSSSYESNDFESDDIYGLDQYKEKNFDATICNILKEIKKRVSKQDLYEFCSVLLTELFYCDWEISNKVEQKIKELIPLDFEKLWLCNDVDVIMKKCEKKISTSNLNIEHLSALLLNEYCFVNSETSCEVTETIVEGILRQIC